MSWVGVQDAGPLVGSRNFKPETRDKRVRSFISKMTSSSPFFKYVKCDSHANARVFPRAEGNLWAHALTLMQVVAQIQQRSWRADIDDSFSPPFTIRPLES